MEEIREDLSDIFQEKELKFKIHWGSLCEILAP